MPFQIVRASCVGRKINEAEKEHSSKAGFLFGISRGNRYFSRELLEALITTGLEQRKRVVLMLPDVPAVSTLMALGYCLTDAERRSRLDFNSMQHRIGRVLEALTPSQRQLVRVLRWKDLEDLPRYEQAHADLDRLYHSDYRFCQDVRDMTKQILQSALERGELRDMEGRPLEASRQPIENVLEHETLERRIDTGVAFPLKELALIADAAGILDLEKCAYVYHTSMKVVENLLDGGHYPWQPHVGNGYLIYVPFAYVNAPNIALPMVARQ